jgi:soluble lytic murein transglycosylase-like protein
LDADVAVANLTVTPSCERLAAAGRPPMRLVHLPNEIEDEAESQQYQQTVGLFRRYAAQYRFDYLLLLAQGYQESHLDQSKVSPVGAIDILQIMPATGYAHACPFGFITNWD